VERHKRTTIFCLSFLAARQNKAAGDPGGFFYERPMHRDG
jgi:hypothetical protein